MLILVLALVLLVPLLILVLVLVPVPVLVQVLSLNNFGEQWGGVSPQPLRPVHADAVAFSSRAVRNCQIEGG